MFIPCVSCAYHVLHMLSGSRYVREISLGVAGGSCTIPFTMPMQFSFCVLHVERIAGCEGNLFGGCWRFLYNPHTMSMQCSYHVLHVLSGSRDVRESLLGYATSTACASCVERITRGDGCRKKIVAVAVGLCTPLTESESYMYVSRDMIHTCLAPMSSQSRRFRER